MEEQTHATQVVQTMVKRGRARFAIAFQTVVISVAAALVWGVLARYGYQRYAYTIIGVLVGVELIILLVFLLKKPDSDELGVEKIADTQDQLVLFVPDTGNVILDKKHGRLHTEDNKVSIPMEELRYLQVDGGEPAQLLAATQRDLVLIAQIYNASASQKADLRRTARRLARSAAIPFEGDDA